MARRETETDKQLEVAREVMARRKEALEQLADMKLADQIMEEDREILRKLAE